MTNVSLAGKEKLMKQHLIIDWGNTRVKVAVFVDGELIKHATEEFVSPEWLLKFKPDLSTSKVLLCSVSSRSSEAERFLSQQTEHFIKLSHQTPLPLNIQYATPETLGYDRLANAIAAGKRSDSEYALAIDVGTCIKYDLVHREKGYLGGAISPGLQMRYRALHRDTSALPRLNSESSANLVGTSTAGSIHSGVFNGMLAEIDGIIQRYQNDYKSLTLFLTGGDAQLFEKALKNHIFANSFLTLFGLNDILEFNDNA